VAGQPAPGDDLGHRFLHLVPRKTIPAGQGSVPSTGP
jgi:hypothetical protein